MIGYLVLGHHLRSGWCALLALLRAPSAAASMTAASAGAVLLLLPAGTAWPNANIADALASAAILDWVKGSLGLIFLLRRRRSNTHGD